MTLVAEPGYEPGVMRALLLVALLACGGAQPRTTTIAQPSDKPLYDRIGGMDAIKAIVDDLAEHAPVRDRLERLLCEETGGPCKYTGRALRDAHANLAIGAAEFAAFMDVVAKTLARRGLAAKEQTELLAIFEKRRAEIVAQ